MNLYQRLERSMNRKKLAGMRLERDGGFTYVFRSNEQATEKALGILVYELREHGLLHILDTESPERETDDVEIEDQLSD